MDWQRDASRTAAASEPLDPHTPRKSWLDEVIIEVQSLFFVHTHKSPPARLTSSLCNTHTPARLRVPAHARTPTFTHSVLSSFELISLSLSQPHSLKRWAALARASHCARPAKICAATRCLQKGSVEAGRWLTRPLPRQAAAYTSRNDATSAPYRKAKAPCSMSEDFALLLHLG